MTITNTPIPHQSSSTKLTARHEGNDSVVPPSSSASPTPEASTPARAKQPIPPFIIRSTAIASLGGILFGYDMGVVSGALPQLVDAFALSQREEQRIVSFLYLGGGLGAACGGTLVDVAGRKRGILLTDLIFILGAGILYCAQSVSHVLWGRITVGFAVSVSGVADVAYLHEIAPSEWRGSIVSVNEACISLGFLLAYAAGYGISQVDPDSGWRVMFGLSGFVAMIQFIGMWGMPESPVWLRERGRLEESQQILEMIHRETTLEGSSIYQRYHEEADGSRTPHLDTSRTDRSLTEKNESEATERIIGDWNSELRAGGVSPRETPPASPSEGLVVYQTETGAGPASQYEAIAMAPAEDGNDQSTQATADTLNAEIQYDSPTVFYEVHSGSLNGCLNAMRHSCVELRHTLGLYHRQISIALFLSITQQFCGQTNVLNYAPLIFNTAGLVSSKSSLGSTLLVGVVKFAMTVLVIWKIEYFGRRKLLLSGMSIISFSLILLTIAFSGIKEDDRQDGKLGGNVRVYLSLLGVMGVVMGYSASFGPLTWLLTSELFPTDIRGRALGVSTIVTYLCASFVTNTFLTLQEFIGSSATFATYGIITTLGVLYAYFAIPDTGGKSEKEIEIDLDGMWWWRRRRQANQYAMFGGLSGKSGGNVPQMV